MSDCCGIDTFVPRLRPTEAEKEIDAGGAFVRQQNRFTTPFGDGENDLHAEKGKYRLFWAKGCNWSNRSAIVLDLLGLKDTVSVQLVGHSKEGRKYGWEFVYNEGDKDPVTGVRYLSQLYYNADPDYEGRCTVPALVDITTKKVINNNYHRLTNYFEVNFRRFQKKHAPDLYPEEIREDIDRLNDWLFPHVNNAPYRMNFAQSLSAYHIAFEDFYDSLDQLEERLEENRFLFGDYITDSDVRLYTTLARFDTRYASTLGPIKKRVVDYKNLWAYARDLYAIPEFRRNTYLHDIATERRPSKESGYQNFYTKFGDDVDYDGIWSAPQDRFQLSKIPWQKFRIES